MATGSYRYSCAKCGYVTNIAVEMIAHAKTHEKAVEFKGVPPVDATDGDQHHDAGIGESSPIATRKPRSDKGVKREPGKGLLAALNTLEQVPVEPLTHAVRRGGRKPKPNITPADIGHLYVDSESGRCFRLMDVQSEPQVTFQVISGNPTDVPNTSTGDLSKFKDFKRLILEK